MGSIQKSHSEAEALASLLSAPGFQRWLRSQKEETCWLRKIASIFVLCGKRKPLLRLLQLRDAMWGKARDQKSRERTQSISTLKSAAGIREKEMLEMPCM